MEKAIRFEYPRHECRGNLWLLTQAGCWHETACPMLRARVLSQEMRCRVHAFVSYLMSPVSDDPFVVTNRQEDSHEAPSGAACHTANQLAARSTVRDSGITKRSRDLCANVRPYSPDSSPVHRLQRPGLVYPPHGIGEVAA